MSDRLCGCCPHLLVRSEKLDSFYNEHFIPQGWKLVYLSLSEGVALYLTGCCRDCGGDLEERVLLTNGLSGDKLLSAIYDAMWTAFPYDKKLDNIGYYGPCESRSAFYRSRDRWKTFRRDQAFLRLFHDYDRNQVRLWLEKTHPGYTHKEVLWDTGGSLFCAVLELAKSSGDFEKAKSILDYVLPNEHEGLASEPVELTSYEFDFVPIVNFGCEGIYLDCYLKGKFDESGRHTLHIGTLKTLERSLEAAKIMAELGGVFMYHANGYVNENIHRYTSQTNLEREYLWIRKQAEEGHEH